MKKKYILIIVVVIIIGLVVIAYAHNKQIKDHYIEIQEKRIDLYFKYDLNNYHSMKITSFKKTPMGGYIVDGYVNHNKNYDFKVLISATDNHQFEDSIGYDDKTFGKLFKEKDHKNELKSTDIIKKEHLDKSDYEADPPLFFFSGRLE
ncbi:DUF1433 domain-containing protein [Staphylococcus aureus]|uniref:DUF1433 domain-containing protein n=1 Tax=Staphylococcus aureus TaxID=1280 RepID=UPI001EEB7593|nr:DUF1433 domain-containing protein [Staphylococcus aureus]MCG6513166.1 DUF1433 domain-containing protein [Staphylococcus aureus]WJB04074.1 DUF1433 domain-containing protein [Staphylococcus aureus]WJB74559.1 DUF1433 domain-containing protein [Staphylococcus aureus]HDM8804662.1 DUF1433 domain-containing protein [Staphylococcus aureus]HDM8951723.1 DUF1433 domain-containing protein [Staphylococcus aureus]